MINNEDFSSTIHGDEKLNSIRTFPLSRIRRRQSDSKLNDIEKASYISVDSSSGWLGIDASPPFSFYGSYLQQKVPSLNVRSVMTEDRYLRILKSHGTSICYPTPPASVNHTTSILIFFWRWEIKRSQLLLDILFLQYDQAQFRTVNRVALHRRTQLHQVPIALFTLTFDSLIYGWWTKNSIPPFNTSIYIYTAFCLYFLIVKTSL